MITVNLNTVPLVEPATANQNNNPEGYNQYKKSGGAGATSKAEAASKSAESESERASRENTSEAHYDAADAHDYAERRHNEARASLLREAKSLKGAAKREAEGQAESHQHDAITHRIERDRHTKIANDLPETVNEDESSSEQSSPSRVRSGAGAKAEDAMLRYAENSVENAWPLDASVAAEEAEEATRQARRSMFSERGTNWPDMVGQKPGNFKPMGNQPWDPSNPEDRKRAMEYSARGRTINDRTVKMVVNKINTYLAGDHDPAVKVEIVEGSHVAVMYPNRWYIAYFGD